jgi:hypothetical protein
VRFRLGAVPSDPEFRPEVTGWRSIREPGPVAIQLIALPVAGALLLLVGGLLAVAAPDTALAGDLLVALVLLALVAPLHEMGHALLTPRFGTTAHTLIGFWPAKLLFYACYDAPLSRGRHILVSVAPLLLLSALPVGLLALGAAREIAAETRSALAFLGFVNAAASAGDAVGVTLILAQVPSSAEVRFNGWRTYWRESGRLSGTSQSNRLPQS